MTDQWDDKAREIAAMSGKEIVALMQDGSPLARARTMLSSAIARAEQAAMLSSAIARAEQAAQQRRPPTTIESRRQEFLDTLKVLAAGQAAAQAWRPMSEADETEDVEIIACNLRHKTVSRYRWQEKSIRAGQHLLEVEVGWAEIRGRTIIRREYQDDYVWVPVPSPLPPPPEPQG